MLRRRKRARTKPKGTRRANCPPAKGTPFGGLGRVQVVSVPADTGTATALRAVSERLTHCASVLVVSGDLVCDYPPALLASRHCARNAIATALLTMRKQTTDPEVASPSARLVPCPRVSPRKSFAPTIPSNAPPAASHLRRLAPASRPPHRLRFVALSEAALVSGS